MWDKDRFHPLSVIKEKEAVLPPWLKRKIPKGKLVWETEKVIKDERLYTVCEEAKCPNLPECWSKKTATFLAMGKECTRACGFCEIDFSKTPKKLDVEEAEKIAKSVIHLNLRHVVITMVARDDLEDGGAHHLAKIIKRIKELPNQPTVEILTSDFNGNFSSFDILMKVEPDIFNYNIETVKRLTSRVRHIASYERTLQILRYLSDSSLKFFVKSGMMLGLGETEEEVFQTLKDLKAAGCQIVTIGQYLQPSKKKLRVKEFITPEKFKLYEEFGRDLGIEYVFSGPFVRSSYNAESVMQIVKTRSSFSK